MANRALAAIKRSVLFIVGDVFIFIGSFGAKQPVYSLVMAALAAQPSASKGCAVPPNRGGPDMTNQQHIILQRIATGSFILHIICHSVILFRPPAR